MIHFFSESHKINLEELDTGDIILYQTSFWYSRLIEYFTGSNYSHISIVLKKPIWLDSSLTDDYYLLESGGEVFPDAVSGKMVFGVQIAPMSKVIHEYRDLNYGSLYCRKLQPDIPKDLLQESIKNAYILIKDKPYDLHPLDWLNALVDLDKPIDKIKKEQRTDCFWCSALVSFIYYKMGFLPSNIPWTIVSPSDYSYTCDRLPFQNCSLDKDLLLNLQDIKNV